MILDGPLAYGAVYVSAILEGEVMFVTAALLVAAGQLSAVPVVIAGALGATTGDQIYFYLFRGRIHSWVSRIRLIAARHEAITSRVRHHEVGMILALRFAPGLRIAIAAACAYAHVRPLKFSALNALSALGWATALMLLVTKIGPGVLDRIGLHGIWGAIVPALLIVLFAWWLGRELKQPESDS
jgi:membrane protein DedA with SNARE-associated domain